MSKRQNEFTIWAWKSPRPSLTQCTPNTRKRLKFGSSQLVGSSINMNPRDSFFVGFFSFVLFDSPRTVYRAGLSGSIADVDLLSVFRRCPPPPFFFSKEQNWHVLSGGATTPVFYPSVSLAPVNSCNLLHFLLRCSQLQRPESLASKGLLIKVKKKKKRKEEENTCPAAQFVLGEGSVLAITKKYDFHSALRISFSDLRCNIHSARKKNCVPCAHSWSKSKIEASSPDELYVWHQKKEKVAQTVVL